MGVNTHGHLGSEEPSEFSCHMAELTSFDGSPVYVYK